MGNEIYKLAPSHFFKEYPMAQTMPQALVANFLGQAPQWYKKTIIAFLVLLFLIFLLSWSVIRRRRSEANLLASEYFLSSVLDNLPDIVFVKDAETLRFVRINKTAERYFGRSAEDIIGKNDYDFFPPDEADFFTKKDKETLKNQIQVNIPLERIQTPEGRRYLNTKKIPILSNKQQSLYLLGISRDITEEINELRQENNKCKNLKGREKISLFLTRFNNEEDHVPQSDNFLVF